MGEWDRCNLDFQAIWYINSEAMRLISGSRYFILYHIFATGLRLSGVVDAPRTLKSLEGPLEGCIALWYEACLGLSYAESEFSHGSPGYR